MLGGTDMLTLQDLVLWATRLEPAWDRGPKHNNAKQFGDSGTPASCRFNQRNALRR